MERAFVSVDRGSWCLKEKLFVKMGGYGIIKNRITGKLEFMEKKIYIKQVFMEEES